MRMAANENLGAISPNLYNAAKKADLSPTGKNILNNFVNAYQTGIQLNQMDSSAARKSFLQFGKEEQKQIVATWGEKEYSKPEESIIDKTFNVLKTYNPINALINTVSTAGKTFYAYDRARMGVETGIATTLQVPIVKRDESVWNANAWNKAYDGKEVYNQDELNKVVKEYGPIKTKIAQSLIAGDSFGEALQKNSLDGKINEEFVDVYESLNKNQEELGALIDKTRLAQYSVGRNITNFLTAKIPPENVTTNFNPFATALLKFAGIDKKDMYKILRIGKNTTSGTLDAGALVFGDPLTYMSFGWLPAARGATKVEKYFREADLTSVFKLKEVQNGWNNVGPLLESLSKTTDPAEKVSIRNKIAKYDNGRLQNTDVQDYLAENKVFDLQSAEKFFNENINDVKILGSGSVEGISLWKNTIPFARTQRYSTNITNRLIDMTFNKPQYADDAVGRTLLNSKADDFLTTARELGMQEDFAATGQMVSRIRDIEKDADNFANRLRRNFQKSPQGLPVIYGKDASKSVEAVRLYAQQLYTRDLANVIAEIYPTLSTADQILTMRGIYASIMLKVGADPKYIEEALEKTFTNKGNFTTFTNVDIPMGFDRILSPHITRGINNAGTINVSGALQPRQLADAVAPLDFKKLFQNSSRTKAYGTQNVKTSTYIKNNKREFLKNTYQAMGRTEAAELINSWGVVSQLYPRMALRSVPEEFITLAWALPLNLVRDIATGKGRQYAEFLTVFSGSDAAVGPFFKTPLNKIRKKGQYAISDTVRSNIADTIAARKNLVYAAQAKKYGTTPKVVNPEDITPAELLEELFYITQSIVRIENPTDLKRLHSLIVHRPDILGNFGASLSSSTGIDGRVSRETAEFIFPQDAAVKALAELGGRKTKEYKKVDPLKLAKQAPDQLTFIHKNAIDANFGGNNVRVLSNNRTFDPSVTFFTHQGLKTDYNFTTAVDELLGKLDIGNPKSNVLRDYIDQYASTPALRKSGLNDAEIAKGYIETILLDLRQTFHGSGNGYNYKLFNAIQKNYNDLVKNDPKRKGKWGIATKAIDQVEFAKLTKDNLPATEINSVFDFEKISLKEQVLALPQKGMEQMDRIITAFVRQQAATVLYMASRNRYDVWELKLSNQMYDDALKNNPTLDTQKLRIKTDNFADAYFTNLAATESINTLMKYVDNPGIQSNLAVSGRFLSRYYRAGEDFIRRSGRILDEQGVEKLLRMRLLFQGLEPRGEIYQNDNDEVYYVFPTDNIINGAINPTLKRFGLEGIYGNLDITTKLSSLGPSLAADANRPTLSNVTGMISVKIAQSLLNIPDQPLTTYVSSKLDDLALGPQGGHLEWQKIINFGIQGTIFDLYQTYADPDSSQKINSAMIQALSYDQAHSIGIPKFDSDEKNIEAESIYLNNLKIKVQNIMAINSIFNRTMPATFQLKEGKDLSIADRLAGMNSIRPVFFDIYNGLIKTDPTLDSSAAYEQAISIFNRDNPGMSVYTISRDQKQTNVLLAQTEEFKNWIIFNKSFIKKYEESSIGYIFAPRSGNFNSSVYLDLEAFGLVKDLKYKDYLNKIKVNEDKVKYYAIDNEMEKELLQTVSPAKQKEIKTKAEDRKRYLKQSNPFLERALGGTAPGTADEKVMLQALKEVVKDNKAPITETQKINMSYALDLMTKFMAYADSPVSRNDSLFTTEKKNKDVELRKSLKQIGLVDEAVREANRAVFTPILNNLTRYESTVGIGN